MSVAPVIPSGSPLILDPEESLPQKKSSAAGTFARLATLKRYEGCENAAEGLCGLTWRTQYD